MRSFFSAKRRWWKDAILKIKMRKKLPAFTLVATSLAVLTWILIAQSFAMMSSGAMDTAKTQRVTAQAVEAAKLDDSMYQENSRCTNTRCPWELSVSEDFFVSRQMDTPWAS